MDELKDKLIEALELDNQDNWDAAHEIVQQIEDPRAYWIHAYLHRKEGDIGNARYWYSRANQDVPQQSLEHEWLQLHKAISSS